MLAAGVNDQIEVIIVNDGSKDKTIDIANSYKAKFPETVVVIDKSNGHYGSCVNAALRIATGKYFRIVDADDWVDSRNLAKVVVELNRIDVDVVFTKYSLQYVHENRVVEQSTDGIVWNKILDLNDFKIPEACCAMHSITVRLDFLRAINYVQTEGICYTDTEYVYFPMIQAKSMYCFDLSLYQYFIGRDDQTMSRISLAKNYSHFYKLLQSMIHYEESPHNYNKNYNWLHNRYYSVVLQFLFLISFLYNKYDARKNMELKSVFSEVIKQSNGLEHVIREKKVLRIPMIKHWMENSVLFSIDKILISFYRRFCY
jgi:glycosyltransferase involved in cell wall biosynthesis